MNDNQRYTLKCVSCNREYDELQAYTRCLHCGDSLDVAYNYSEIEAGLNKVILKTAPLKAMKYHDFYPLKDLRKIVTLHEGGTPLYRCKNLGKKLGLENLFIKNEGLNPTGAFKDRGTMIEVTKALEMNKKGIICASTGNMAASVSAYAAKAKIPCFVIVPEGTPIGKLSQTLSYGAKIIQIRGTYDEANKIATEISKKNDFYLAGDYAFRLEGNKSVGYEIIEQLGWESPDKIIIPIGCGTNLSAVWKGLKEFEIFGLVEKLPHMVGVQAAGAAPIVEAFNNNKKRWTVIEKPQTVASAMCIGDPLDGTKALKALRESLGLAMSVDDDEILEAEKLLAKEESVFVEPSAAATLAGLKHLVKDRKIEKDEKIVLVLTGTGLKDPLAALKVLPSPPSTEPNVEEVSKFLNYGYYDVYAKSVAKNKVLLKGIPNENMLKKIIKKSFNIGLSKTDLALCIENLRGFKEKGKSVLESDLKLVLENILKQPHLKNKALKILDYKIIAGKREKPVGEIKVQHLGKTIVQQADGVGPVDAIINAIRKSLRKNGFHFKLVDYNVVIGTGGTDAAVDVKMTLMDDKKNKVIAVGTSPDIIVASIQAFEQGYNILYMKNQLKK